MLPARMREDYTLVFAVNSNFLLSSMAGAFVLKGASTYMGWDSGVGIGYVDEATLVLIKNVCLEDMTIEEAIAETMAQAGAEPSTGARLRYYPPESGAQTIKELIGWEAGGG